MNSHSKARAFFVPVFAAFGTLCLLSAAPASAAEDTRQLFADSIGMSFQDIPPGSFMRGCTRDAEDCYDFETPQRRIDIAAFGLARHEVTQAQWEAVMGDNPSTFKDPAKPVENVSWDDVQEFLRRMNEKEGRKRYRLPTEAEWEYAARAGSATTYSFGNDESRLDDHAWHGDGGNGGTHPVGGKLPNAWSLYDMHGNVWEWVEDRYGADYYATSRETANPTGPETGDRRVIRGGAWNSVAGACRSAARGDAEQAERSSVIGFRVAIDLGE